MISPHHIRAYSLRSEEILVESSRERLMAQGYPAVNLPRETRHPSPTRVILTVLTVIAGWVTSLS